MQAVERIANRDTSKNFWLHVAFQAVHGGAHREATDTCDLLPAGAGTEAADGYRNAGCKCSKQLPVRLLSKPQKKPLRQTDPRCIRWTTA